MSSGIQPATPGFDLLGMDRQIQRRVARQRTLHVAAWTGLAALGLRKGGVLGWLGAGAGLFALARELLLWREQQPEWRKSAAHEPSTLGRLLRTRHADPVDRASANSFPASDPPSHDTH